jgi:hypothetical protein
MQALYVNDPNQVVSVSKIEADLGVDDRRLLVLSGIARPEWHVDDSDTQHEDIQVHLGEHVRDIEQVSVLVGLASIYNDDSEFVFAVDTARVELDPVSAEMLLIVNAAVTGTSSTLNRMSYQIVATVVAVTNSISGVITWPTSLFRPDGYDLTTLGMEMRVVANTYLIGQPTSDGFITEIITPVAFSHILGFEIGTDECTARYRIDNPPLAQELTCTIELGDVFRPPGMMPAVGSREAGPYLFTLSLSAPSVEGENFTLSRPDIR